MNITTTYTSNASGRSQVLAKGGGKQRTVSVDPSKSSDWNHGNAAGTLARVLFQGEASRRLAAKTATYKVKSSGVYVFTLGV